MVFMVQNSFLAKFFFQDHEYLGFKRINFEILDKSWFLGFSWISWSVGLKWTCVRRIIGWKVNSWACRKRIKTWAEILFWIKIKCKFWTWESLVTIGPRMQEACEMDIYKKFGSILLKVQLETLMKWWVLLSK